MSTSQQLRLRALVRAIELCGGPGPLAHYLRISAAKLTYLIDGAAPVPEELFVRIVDLLIARDITKLTEQSRSTDEASQ